MIPSADALPNNNHITTPEEQLNEILSRLGIDENTLRQMLVPSN